MILQIPNTVGAEALTGIVSRLDRATWTADKLTDKALIDSLQAEVLGAIEAAPKFLSAALPTRILPPVIRRLESQQAVKASVHRTIRGVPGSGEKARADLIATLFLSDPNLYTGGYLVLRDVYGEHSFRLPAGTLLLYPAALQQYFRANDGAPCYHAQIAIQSMIRDSGQRKILFDMDTAIQALAADTAGHPALDRLTGVYHNLLRYWANS
jgi:PKHD-type hydroxylase